METQFPKEKKYELASAWELWTTIAKAKEDLINKTGQENVSLVGILNFFKPLTFHLEISLFLTNGLAGMFLVRAGGKIGNLQR